MTEADWLAQQRQIVRAFRQASAERADAQAAAMIDLWAQQNEADSALNVVREDTPLLTEILKARKSIVDAMRFAGLGYEVDGPRPGLSTLSVSSARGLTDKLGWAAYAVMDRVQDLSQYVVRSIKLQR